MSHRARATWKRLAAVGAVLFCVSPATSQTSQDIYRINLRTGVVRRVSNIPGTEAYNPAWAPDGSKIAHDVKGASAPLGHSVYVTTVNTSVSTFLTGADGGNDATWSPDGRNIAFDRFPESDFSIYFVPAAGGTRKLIRADAIQPAWAPDSKRLAFRQHSDGAIRTINKNGTGETVVVTAGSDPVWSPDGRFIAYANGGDIWKVRVNSSGMPLKPPVQVTTDPADDGQPSWSSDSQTIVFHSSRSGDYDIWTVPAAGGTATRLTGTVGQGDYDPAVSANGRFAAYSGFNASPLQKAANQNALSVPVLFNLAQNYPNPFNPETEILFQLPEASHVVVKIFNALGAEIRTLAVGRHEAGYHLVRWDGKDNNGNPAASGVYLYQLRTSNFSQVRRMNLVR